MNPFLALSIEAGLTILACVLLTGYLRHYLKRVLVDLCKTEERAQFWAAFSNILLIGLPLTGLSIGADGSYIGYDGNSLTDITAFIRYSSDYVFGLEAGIRTVTLELDDVDSTYGKLEFDGPYVSLFLHF